MNQEALRILKSLVTDTSGRQKRLTELLKPAEAEFADKWFMCVPMCFNDSLDIRLTERKSKGHSSLVWTQGSAFSFSAGDTLYDTSDAYKIWSEALKNFSLCVQIRHAISAGSTSDGTGRTAGSVTFDIYKPDKTKQQLVECGHFTMTQDEFVEFLIVGPSGKVASESTYSL